MKAASKHPSLVDGDCVCVLSQGETPESFVCVASACSPQKLPSSLGDAVGCFLELSITGAFPQERSPKLHRGTWGSWGLF